MKTKTTANETQPAAPVEPAPVEPTAPVETPAAPEAPPAPDDDEAPEDTATEPTPAEPAATKPGLVARVVDTITLRGEAKREIARLTSELAKRDTDIGAFRSRIQELTADNAKLTGDLQKAVSRVAELEAASGSIDAKVSQATQQQLAALGVPEGSLPAQAAADKPSAEDLHAQWLTLEGAEKTKFFRQHEAALRSVGHRMNAA